MKFSLVLLIVFAVSVYGDSTDEGHEQTGQEEPEVAVEDLDDAQQEFLESIILNSHESWEIYDTLSLEEQRVVFANNIKKNILF